MGKTQHTGSLPTRLLLRDVSVFQLLIYAVGVFLGLFISIVAFQFFRDIKAADNPASGANGIDYIVLSKRVEGLSFSNGRQSLNTALDSLKKQPWVTEAAAFMPARFNVTVSLNFAGSSMSSALFFESVPDEFLDVNPRLWSFDASSDDAVLPIVLPRDYLALYNFGFAASRGLPKIGEDAMMELPLRISVSGNGRQQYFNARIVGFTSRLNTIAVPQEFIEWGNSVFGREQQQSGARLIAAISVPPSAPEVKAFLQANNMEIGGDKGLMESSSGILTVISSVIIAIGLLIESLSVALLFISIFLLIHKTRQVTYRLLALGYTPLKITGIYTGLFGTVNLVVLGAALAGLFIVENSLSKLLAEAGFGASAAIYPTVLLAVAITLFITVICYIVFRNSLKVKKS